jgi:protein gp37
MADKTRIEWTDATWSPTTGCAPVSEGCVNCWARRQAERFWATQYPGIVFAGSEKGGPLERPRQFSDVQCHEDRLEIPLHWKRPRKIAVSLMGDLWHESIPDAFIDRVFAVMALCPQHTFQVLTKRPERMLRWFNETASGAMRETLVYQEALDTTFKRWPARWPGWPLSNVWLLISAENQPRLDERVSLLLQTPAAVRGVSLEPLLSGIDIAKHRPGANHLWFIVGGESGPHARPSHPDWFRSVRDQCVRAGVPYFFKQWGEWQEGSRLPKFSGEIVLNDGRHARYAEDFGHIDCMEWGRLHPTMMARVGKKAAGRLLDGREWSEFPEARG